MKTILPPLELSETTGFDPDVDIFGRKDFGERLANFVEFSSDNPVIALDAGWGEGKTTFIQMWRGYLEHQRDQKIRTIYFDAFENDYQKDGFLALASEIYKLIDCDEKKQHEYKENAIRAVKSLSRGAIKLSVKLGTAGIIDGTAVDNAEKGISELVSDQVDNLIQDRFEHAQKDKLALENFKNYLTGFAVKEGQGAPILFIIDELDRCRPDFALEILEQVKHLFSVSGITFLLVTNRKQLEASVETRYGAGIETTVYLNKFISLWFSLPSNVLNDSDAVKFFDYALNRMSDSHGIEAGMADATYVLRELIRFSKPSCREIEKTLTYYSILINLVGKSQYQSYFQFYCAITCYLRAIHPNLFKETERNTFLERLTKTKVWKQLLIASDDSHIASSIKAHIDFDLADENSRMKMLANNEIPSDVYYRSKNSSHIFRVNGYIDNMMLN